MTNYGIILNVGVKYLHLGSVSEVESTEIVAVEKVPKEWMRKEVWEPGVVLDLPGDEVATTFRPGGAGGGGRQVPVRHDLLELHEAIEDQADLPEYEPPRVDNAPEEEQITPPPEQALDLLQKPVQRELRDRGIEREYKALKQGESDFETVPEIADHFNVSNKTVYRVVKERLEPDDRLLPSRLVQGESPEREEGQDGESMQGELA